MTVHKANWKGISRWAEISKEGLNAPPSLIFQVTSDISFLGTGKGKGGPHTVQNKALPGCSSHGLSKPLKTQLKKLRSAGGSGG